MRPRRLCMQAFGPFAKRQVIDFDALGEDPLFLIHGPTGAGKTSILDAICFALYGETTGGERKGGQMRCDLAEPATLTEVVLDFELAGQLYRVRRVPEQARPKKSGEGTTEQKPEAQLWELDELVELDDSLPPTDRSRSLVAKKVTAATAKVAEITGLSADQFRQVMVLPQGKFRQLLLAETGDREKIFAELFQTHVYEQLEASLKEEALVIERQVKELLASRESILEFVGVETIERLGEEIATKRQEHERAQASKVEAEKHVTTVQARFTAAEQLAAKFAELREAERKLAELDAHAVDLEAKRSTERRARAALAIRHPNDQRIEAEKQEREARIASDAASGRLREAASALEAAQNACEGIADRKAELGQRQQRIRELEALRARAAAVETAKVGLQETRTALEDATTLERQKHDAVGKPREALESEERELAGVRKQIEPLSDQETKLRLLKKLALDLKSSGRLLGQRETVQQARKRAAAEFETATRLHGALDMAWRAGQAAILAEALEEGSPCPVCGSEHHPHPARSEAELPSQVDVEQARDALEQKRDALDARKHDLANYEREVANLDARIAEMRTELGESVPGDLETLEQACLALESEVAALLEIKQGISKREESISLVREALETATKEHESARSALQTASSRATAAKERYDVALQELPEDHREPGALQAATEQAKQRHLELQQSIEVTEKALTQAREGHARAETDAKTRSGLLETQIEAHRVALELWQRALAASEFTDQADFDRALAQIEGLEALAQELRDFDDARLEARTTARDKSSAVAGEADPDLEPIRAARNEARSALEACDKALHDCAARKKQLEDAFAKLEASARDRQRLEQEFALVGTIANVTNGRNAHNLSLQRYVLAVLLDEVLLDADDRLKHMTRGRYRLRRKEDLTHGAKKAGLDLEVEDAWTGSLRDVATLSGGESFMAALALALGLSDVVQAHAGGIRLDTLFIDEGFGSLDPDSLERAIEALLQLQASGRMVGVISHVGELKERIDVRLELVADERGSHARLVVP